MNTNISANFCEYSNSSFETKPVCLSLFEDALFGVIVLNQTGDVIHYNQHCATLFDHQPLNMAWSDLVKKHFILMQDDGFEVSLRNGKRLTILTQAIENQGQLVILVDQTHSRQYQDQISQNQKMRSIGTLLGEIVHQIRTPLSTAHIYVNNLMRPNLSEEKKDQYIAKLSKKLKDMDDQIDNMLIFAKGGKGIVERLRVLDVVTTILDDYPNRNLQLINQCEERIDALQIYANKQAIVGALRNIISNAFEASQEGQLVSIIIGRNDDAVSISVENDGLITQEIKQKIFEPFFSTKKNGNGLGLIIAKQVIDTHKGQLEVETTDKGCTRFTCSLPLVRIKQIVKV